VTYYEELAVPQDASLEEIHQAYRVVARLLHPDTQPDPKLKSAAERQMTRINEMLSILTDPERRYQYDESLCEKLMVEAPAPALKRLPIRLLQRHWPWGLACCILLVAGISYLRYNESGEPSAPKSPVPLARPSALSPLTSRAERPSRFGEPRSSGENRSPGIFATPSRASPPPEHLDSNRSPPARPVDRLPEPSEPAASAPGPAKEAASVPVEPAPAAEASVRFQATAEQPAAPVLAGHWFYTAGTLDPETPGMYPPEFIELFLSENQGTLLGKYWARYRIANKAVSPEVQFRIYGTASKGTAIANAVTARWVSDDGAKGQLKMMLRDANSMEVSWWTSEFGRHMALTSGSALLVRQQTR